MVAGIPNSNGGFGAAQFESRQTRVKDYLRNSDLDSIHRKLVGVFQL